MEGFPTLYIEILPRKGWANPGDLEEGCLGRIKGLVVVAIPGLALGAVPSSESFWFSAR